MKKTVIFLILIILTSCSKNLKNSLEELGVLPRQQSNEYLKAFVSATKSYKYYDQFETKSIIKVTYFSSSFLNSYLEERKKFMKEEEYKYLEDKERQIKKSTIRFFISLYTPEPEFSNLLSTKNIWQIYIENNAGHKIKPVAIKKAQEPYQVLNYFFPTLDSWATPYYITFELEPNFLKERENFKLFFKSVVGYGEFNFQYE